MGTFVETSLNYIPQRDIDKGRTPITFNLFRLVQCTIIHHNLFSFFFYVYIRFLILSQ